MEMQKHRKYGAFATADNGNRTRLPSLGSWCSTDELYLHEIIITNFSKNASPDFYFSNRYVLLISSKFSSASNFQGMVINLVIENEFCH